jgi:DNA-binding NarL/FixJ family response regulator
VDDAMVDATNRRPADIAVQALPYQDVLTPRQIEVLTCIASGLSTKEIANLLSLSVKTVETHRAALMQRLRIFNVAGLTRYAIRQRLIEP